MQGVFIEIGVIIIIATLIGYFARILRQPIIPAYIITGMIIGPFGLGLISDVDLIKILAEIGIAFLLFVVGLELDFKRLRDIGYVASVGGTIRMIVLFSLGFVLAMSFGVFSSVESTYIGLIVAFSSTMIVIKILSDNKELETLHGRIVIGVLLMEDLLAILVLSFITTSNGFSAIFILFSILKTILIFIVTIFASRFIFPIIFRHGAKSKEILFLLSITVCFLFSIVINMLGFSIVIGAFLAGVALANLPYNYEIISLVKPIRDFFATLFFVSLGMELMFNTNGGLLIPLIVLIGFIVIFKPILTIMICKAFGYARRTSFLSALSLAQISEFSLIIVGQGILVGHISGRIAFITVVLAVVTMSISTYYIHYDNVLYRIFSRPLKIFDLIGLGHRELEYKPEKKEYNYIVIGYDRIGYSIVKKIQKMKKSMVVVDFNPEIIHKLIRKKIPCLYGDIGDLEIIDQLDFKNAKVIVSTIADMKENLLLIKKAKYVNNKILTFLTAQSVDEALEFYDQGADYVILPHFLGGEMVSLLIEEVTIDFTKLVSRKKSHIAELRHRRDIGHEHPKRKTRQKH